MITIRIAEVILYTILAVIWVIWYGQDRYISGRIDLLKEQIKEIEEKIEANNKIINQ